MSRSGYSDYLENWSLIRWRGAVASALRGKRGQAFLREALEALDALPAKELIANDLRKVPTGAVCTLGAVGLKRATPMDGVDVEDHCTVAGLFDVPHALACEIMWENDDGGPWDETPAQRFDRMRRWIVGHLKAGSAEGIAAPVAPQPREAD